MATFDAYDQFRLSLANFYFSYLNQYYAEFGDNQPILWEGVSYNDYVYLEESSTFGPVGTLFLGQTISVNMNGAVTGGTVQALGQAFVSGPTPDIFWSISGISVPATSIYNAFLTPSTTDDFQLFASALAGADDIEMSDFADEMSGYAGADTIFAYAGDDTIYGGMGDDDVFGGDGHDALFGNDGNDYIEGNDGDDTLSGDAGADLLDGGTGNDTLYGGAGNDFLWASAGNDAYFGGDGLDFASYHDGDRGSDDLAGLGIAEHRQLWHGQLLWDRRS